MSISDILHEIYTGNGYHWKGLYVESMQKSICRGLKSKVKDFPDVRVQTSFFSDSLKPFHIRKSFFTL